jgi:branched-chain amino acid transport system ATP-binding protein
MLHVTKLYAGYKDVQILDGVSLDVHQGEVVAVIGANGAGKTTLMRSLSGTIDITGGSVQFNQKELRGLPTHEVVKAGLIHVPEAREVFADLTVEQNLMLGAFTRKSKGERLENREKVFSIFPRLGERLNQKAGTMSGGEQQMLAIARGLMASPKLLMLDEPSLGLSPKLVDEIFELILAINKELNMTILLVEQNVAEALEVAHRGYILQTGHMISSGTSEQLKDDPIVQKAYLGI